MEDFNRITFTGNVVADPELRSTNSGVPVCTIRAAIKTGENETMFKDVVCWRSTAEYVSKYIHKGDRLLVDGKARDRVWTGKDGKKNTVTEIEATSVRNISARKSEQKPQEFQEVQEDDGDLPF